MTEQSMNAGRDSTTGVNHGVHALRGLAAFAVVLVHSITLAVRQFPSIEGIRYEYLGAAVDVFFVISGFIMVHSTRKWMDARLPFKSFLVKRLTRIVPLYWFFTMVVSLLAFARPGLSEYSITAEFVAKSMLFIPTHTGPDILRTTVVAIGWTLVYEFWFYVLFGLFASVNYKKGLMALGAVMIAVVAVYPQTRGFMARWLTDPVIANFVAGMALGFVTPERLRRFSWILIPVGFLWLWLLFPNPGESRGNYMRLWAAVPGAFMLVAGFAALRIRRPLPMLSLLGDTSYSMYLGHMYLIKIVAARLHTGLEMYVLILAATGIVAGIVVHFLIERPLMRGTRRLFSSF